MSIEKVELRARARTLRSAMPQEVRAAASAVICETILASSLFADCRMLLCYAPLGSEVDVLPVAQAALEQGKVVGFPICHGEEMEFYAVSSRSELCQTDRFGAGNRIGYGKGYYDRYLHRALAPPITLGVTYAATLLEHIPAEATDIPAAYLVTEKEFIRI